MKRNEKEVIKTWSVDDGHPRHGVTPSRCTTTTSRAVFVNESMVGPQARRVRSTRTFKFHAGDQEKTGRRIMTASKTNERIGRAPPCALQMSASKARVFSHRSVKMSTPREDPGRHDP